MDFVLHIETRQFEVRDHQDAGDTCTMMVTWRTATEASGLIGGEAILTDEGGYGVHDALVLESASPDPAAGFATDAMWTSKVIARARRDETDDGEGESQDPS